MIENATAEFWPSADEAAEATRDAIALVDGTLWQCCGVNLSALRYGANLSAQDGWSSSLLVGRQFSAARAQPAAGRDQYCALLDPHNLVLHGGLVYEMAHSRHPLTPAIAWVQEGRGAPRAAWAHRQPLPGAVIPAGRGIPAGGKISPKFNLYEIAVDVSDATPGGGWALGEVVRCRAGGRTYTFKARTGIGIGSARVPVKL